MLHCSPCRLRLNQQFLIQRLQGNSMSYPRRSDLSHIDLSVKRLIKIVVICEINHIIFVGGKLIYDPLYYCDGITDNNLSPEVSHCILLLCKTGLRWFPHWHLAFHATLWDSFTLIFIFLWLPGWEITLDPL